MSHNPTLVGAKLAAENRAKNTAAMTFGSLYDTLGAFQEGKGLVRRHRYVAKFLDMFPWNIVIVFVLVFVSLFGLHQALTWAFSSDSAGLEKERMAAMMALETAEKAGDVQAKVAAQLSLQRINAEMESPANNVSAAMTLISLTAAIGGIFSLPLITSATMNFMGTRAVKAREYAAENYASQ